jgi:hypothetical protein
MQNQLVVSLSPVVADAFVLVDEKAIYSEHLEPCGGRQTGLASAW